MIQNTGRMAAVHAGRERSPRKNDPRSAEPAARLTARVRNACPSRRTSAATSTPMPTARPAKTCRTSLNPQGGAAELLATLPTPRHQHGHRESQHQYREQQAQHRLQVRAPRNRRHSERRHHDHLDRGQRHRERPRPPLVLLDHLVHLVHVSPHQLVDRGAEEVRKQEHALDIGQGLARLPMAHRDAGHVEALRKLLLGEPEPLPALPDLVADVHTHPSDPQRPIRRLKRRRVAPKMQDKVLYRTVYLRFPRMPAVAPSDDPVAPIGQINPANICVRINIGLIAACFMRTHKLF